METNPTRARALKWSARILFSGLIAFLTLEIALRLFSPSIPRFIGNEVFSPYRHDPSGIFLKDSVTNHRFMRPLREQQVVFNNYTWLHQTDRWGFRNPADSPRDILLMGDSMIYGQGVDQEQTVSHFLRRDYNLPVYNMSRTGDSLLQQYVLLRTYLDEFKPKKVVFLVFINDFADLDGYRQEGFDYPTVEKYDYDALLERRKSNEALPPMQVSYALRFLRYLPKHIKSDEEPRHPVRQKAGPVEEPGLTEFSKQTFRELLTDLSKRCRTRGVEMEIVFLYLGDHKNQFAELQEPIDEFLTHLTSELEIPYTNTRGLFQTEDFLPTDGHFSLQGHRRLAEFLHNEVLKPT